MQSKDNLFIDLTAREGLMNGIKKAANAVSVTLGTGGSNSLIECIENPQYFATNDGVTILSNIRFADPLEELGRKILYEAVSRANKASGDGSSTTCVLTAAILDEGSKLLGKIPPMELKRSLEAYIPIIENGLREQRREIGIEDVACVASVSAEDEAIGKLIQEIYFKIGKDGIIHWDVSKTANDSYVIDNGIVVYGAEIVSPYMCDIDDSGRFTKGIRWTDPKILLCRQKITSAADFNDLFQSLFHKNIREVVLFCDEIEIPVVADFIRTRAVRGFKTAVIKMPVIWNDEWWEDMALATGGVVIDSKAGLSLSGVTEEHLGSVGHIVVADGNTYLDGIKDLKKHILSLQVDGSEKALLRASRLNTKTARYFVGAHSESALTYRRLKVEDAINAASLALDDGIVIGGGMALLNVANSLKKDAIGGIILKEALKEPFRCIVSNSGNDYQKVEPNIKGLNMGFNSQTGQIEEIFQRGIVDPFAVVLNAVKNAIGVAASVLTMETVILLPRVEGPIQPNHVL